MKKHIEKLMPKFYGAYLNIASFFSPWKTAKKAFVLFCTPRKGRILPEQESFLNSAKDQLITSDSISVQTYRWPNQGPTVLLMHGWESNSFRWRNLIPRLVDTGFNVIALDAPGHGNSSSRVLNLPLYADCAQKVIEAYGPTHIVGHSLGGMTMIYNECKNENPAVQKLVSLGAPSELSDFMKQFKSILGLSNNLMENLEKYFIRKFGVAFSEFSSPSFARNILKKGLLIHDELDQIAPIRCSEEVHASWRGSRLIRTTGLGHSLHQDRVHEQIIDFLKS